MTAKVATKVAAKVAAKDAAMVAAKVAAKAALKCDRCFFRSQAWRPASQFEGVTAVVLGAVWGVLGGCPCPLKGSLFSA